MAQTSDSRPETPLRFLSRSQFQMRSRIICLSPSPAQSITSTPLSEISRTLSYSPPLSIPDLRLPFTYLEVNNRNRPTCQATAPRVKKRRNRKEAENERTTEEMNAAGKRDRLDRMGNGKLKSPPLNRPLIMSAINESTATRSGSKRLEDQFGEEKVQLNQANEFVAIWFALGHLRSDIPRSHIPISDATPHQISILARIFRTWITNEPKPDILSAVTYGKVLGKQLLHACLDKGLSDKSLLNLVRDMADFYSDYCQDLEDAAGKSINQREEENKGSRGSIGGGTGKGPGRLLKMVLANRRAGSTVPGWGRMIWDANLLFALLHGATKDIGETIEDAERTGI
ncbi:hypothetical protein BKA64DRAFT_645617 [Cadophora sp. MPI-SDFR-AT-0126]|nr:hypothetical protein BKA64DRAFT_645617 [Leotiomycetes sp. MPI-SDFR-AT-0126]